MKYIYFLTLILLGSSCKTVTYSDLISAEQSNHLLPPMQARIDIQSFENAYSTGTVTTINQTVTVPINVSKKGSIDMSFGSSSTEMHTDKHLEDAIIIFRSNVEGNISYLEGEQKGYLLCKILDAHLGHGGAGWLLL